MMLNTGSILVIVLSDFRDGVLVPALVRCLILPLFLVLLDIFVILPSSVTALLPRFSTTTTLSLSQVVDADPHSVSRR